MHTYIPALLNLPPPLCHSIHLSYLAHQAELPVLYSYFPLAIYFIYGSVYMSMLFSQLILPFPSPSVSASPSSMPGSLFLPCK